MRALGVGIVQKPVRLGIHKRPVRNPLIAINERRRARSDRQLVVQAEKVRIVNAQRADLRAQHLLRPGKMRGSKPSLGLAQGGWQLVRKRHDANPRVGPRPGSVGREARNKKKQGDSRRENARRGAQKGTGEDSSGRRGLRETHRELYPKLQQKASVP